MKGEGRQHWTVQTCGIPPNPLDPRPETRFINRFDSPATSGLFTRVLSKPTKFTEKCAHPRCSGCRLHQTCKAKDKTKGNQKLKSKLFDFRVVDAGPWLNFSGVSTTRILDQLSSYYGNEDDHDDEEVSHCYGGDDIYD